MKAAVFEDKMQIVMYDDYPLPEIGQNEALVKVDYCGVCGSDLTNFKYKMYQVPLIMGHEISGVIEVIGDKIQDFKKGDKVCAINVKLDLNEGTLGGLGIFQNGGFAQYVKVPHRYLFHIPDHITTKEAVMAESFANIMRALKLSKIGQNERIIIIGGGNIGLCFLKTLIAEKNPEYIIVIEPHEFLREKAIEFGANNAFPPSKSKIKRFIKSNKSPTFIFDCVAIQDTVTMALDLIERGGTILIEGIHKGSINFPLFMLNSKEVTLKGCLGHDEVDITKAIELIGNEKVKPNDLISKIIQLNQLQEFFEVFSKSENREFIKVIVQL